MCVLSMLASGCQKLGHHQAIAGLEMAGVSISSMQPHLTLNIEDDQLSENVSGTMLRLFYEVKQ